MTLPLVSIVTPTYNSANTLGKTIESVLNQGYSQLEYIIMDGQSTDHTAQVVARYAHDPRLQFISERDSGQTQAINKGWQRARGDILAYLNADDYYELDTVQTVVTTLTEHPDIDWVHGYDRYVDLDGNPIPFNHARGEWNYEQYLRQELYISQPTVFWRREVIERFGYLREDLFAMMDLEYFLRIGRHYPGLLIPKTLATITWSRQTKTFGSQHRRLVELEAVCRAYGATSFSPTVEMLWTEANLLEALRALRVADWQDLHHHLADSTCYPRHLPKALARVILSGILPASAESTLRRLLLRKNTQ